MRTLDETSRLLDLLREAGDQPVTLAELEVVGVSDPASALLDLELAGHAISRVLDERVECVRLAPFDGVHLLAEPAPEPEPVVETLPSAEFLGSVAERERHDIGEDVGHGAGAGSSGRRLVVALVLLVLALVFSRR